MDLLAGRPYRVGVKVKRQPKGRERRRRKEQASLEVQAIQAIPAPTILWHPSISLEKLVSDFAEYRDSIIVS
jgi:hypothetical protein